MQYEYKSEIKLLLNSSNEKTKMKKLSYLAMENIILCIIYLLNIEFVCSKTEGFDLLYTSNLMEYSDISVSIKGNIPEWLSGTLIRNGLGRFEVGDAKVRHAFDGYAKVSSFKFSGQNRSMLFTTKFIKSKFYNDSMAKNDIAPYILFDAKEPDFTFVEKTQALLNGIDNTNVNLYMSGDGHKGRTKVMAVSDFWQSYHIDTESLDTLQYVNAELPVNGFMSDYMPLPSTSHPVREFNKDTHIGFVSYMNPMPFLPSYIHVIRMKGMWERELVASIERKDVPYMHSIALSENYAILFADPLYINMFTVLNSVKPMESLEWFPSQNTDIYVVDLRTKVVTHLETPPMVHIHHINSFERGNQIIVDYVAYPDLKFLKGMTLDNLKNHHCHKNIKQNSQIIRYKINIAKGTVKVKTNLYSRRNQTFINRLDFPTINEQYRHRQYCYAYGIAPKSDDTNIGNTRSLVKKDLCGGRDRYWSRDNHFPSEAIFVANPQGTSEDDGVLLSLVLDGDDQRSYVAIYNATTMKMRVKAKLDDFVPFTLHGAFLYDDILNKG